MADPDDTVILPRQPVPNPSGPRRRPLAGVLAGVAGIVLVAAGTVTWWVMRPVAAPPAATPVLLAPAPPPPPAPLAADAIPQASEADILAERVAVRTVLRFAPNPAVLVVDFPTLAEQGRMLNRIAAWVEKADVPRDRLLPDAELAAAIKASGATPETYYYGHDYRGDDIVRFFALADRDKIALVPEEEDLRRLMRRAQAEPAGFGALISLPRAEAANDVTMSGRASILHHELSHGEYFTVPAYAAFVDTVWRSVLTDSERAAVRTYLGSEGYDVRIEDLMKNEMQAYIMHTPDPMFFDPARLGIPPARLAQIRAAFLAGMPPGWLRDATAAMVRAPRRRRTRRPQWAGRARPQRAGRVSSTTAVAVTVPPRRRRASMAV